MELRQITFAVTLAEELHFGRAAEREHIAQSVLSEQIRRLERELKVQLFDRSTHHVRLTEQGTVFVEGGRALLADLARLVERTTTTAAPAVLRLGCVGTAQWWPAVRDLTEAFEATTPDVALEVTYGQVPGLVDAVVGGALDAAVVNGHYTHPDLAGLLLARVPVEVVVSRAHALARRSEVTLADLDGETLVLWPRDVNPVVYDDILRLLDTTGVRLTVVDAPTLPMAWLGSVAAGEGVALVATANQIAHEGVVRRPLTGPAPELELWVLWPRVGPSPATVRLAALVGSQVVPPDAVPQP